MGFKLNNKSLYGILRLMVKGTKYSEEEIESGNLILESFMDDSFYVSPEDRDKFYYYLKHLCEESDFEKYVMEAPTED